MFRLVQNVLTGNIEEVELTPEEIAEAEAWVDPPPIPYINNGGLARFAGFPNTLLENIRMAAVSRVSKGRYRVYHETPYPTDQYSVACSVLDLNPRVIKTTARTPSYVEVRVTDFSNVAQDPTEATVKTERVITS